MIERVLKESDRERIRSYARMRWNARKRFAVEDGGGFTADDAAIVQQETFAYIKRTRGGGLLGAIMMQIAMKFAAAMIRRWLERMFEDER